MQHMRMTAKPCPLRGVIRAPLGNETPEGGTVSEDPQMGELVDDHGLERPGRGKHEAPREHQATLR